MLYDAPTRTKAWALMDDPSSEELNQFQIAVAHKGLDATYRGKSCFELAAALVEMAQDSLVRQKNLNENQEDESVYLQALVEIIERKQTPAERLLWKLNTMWDGDLGRLWRSRVD